MYKGPYELRVVGGRRTIEGIHGSTERSYVGGVMGNNVECVLEELGNGWNGSIVLRRGSAY